MNLTKNQRSAMITILIVAFVTLLTIYLFISIIFKVQLLTTPCELCVEQNPSISYCVNQQLYYNSIFPGEINLSNLDQEG